MDGNIQYREGCWKGKQNSMREMQRGSIYGTSFCGHSRALSLCCSQITMRSGSCLPQFVVKCRDV